MTFARISQKPSTTRAQRFRYRVDPTCSDDWPVGIGRERGSATQWFPPPPVVRSEARSHRRRFDGRGRPAQQVTREDAELEHPGAIVASICSTRTISCRVARPQPHVSADGAVSSPPWWPALWIAKKLVGTFSPTLNGTVSSTPAPQPGHSMDYRRRFRRVRCRINAVTTRPFSLAKVCPETVHRA